MATKPKTTPEVKTTSDTEATTGELTLKEQYQAQLNHVEDELAALAEAEYHDLTNAVQRAYTRLHEVLTEVIERL